MSPIELKFNDLKYEVKSGADVITLLKDIKGYAKPGMMMALMGPSGAGVPSITITITITYHNR